MRRSHAKLTRQPARQRQRLLPKAPLSFPLPEMYFMMHTFFDWPFLVFGSSKVRAPSRGARDLQVLIFSPK